MHKRGNKIENLWRINWYKNHDIRADTGNMCNRNWFSEKEWPYMNIIISTSQRSSSLLKEENEDFIR
jgi:hypothetical protein